MTPMAALTFLLPLIVWVTTFLMLLVQVMFLLLIETRMAAGILERRMGSYFAAIGWVAALSLYDKEFVSPLLSAIFPKDIRTEVKQYVLISLAAYSFLVLAFTFHYSMDVTKFRGRSLLKFPKPVYRSNPRAVRHLWLRIFSLINVTSCCYLALAPSYFLLSTSMFPEGKARPADWLYLAGLTITGAIAYSARTAILNSPSQVALLAKINYLLAVNSKSIEERAKLSKEKSDPFGWGRHEIGRVAAILERIAKRLDNSANHGTVHPISATYRAAASRFRRFCSTFQGNELPLSIAALLLAIESVAISDAPRWRKYLIRHLEVFDTDGNPRPLPAPPVSRFRQRASVGVQAADQINQLIQNSWQTILIVVALIALALGKLSLDSLFGLAQ